VGRPLQVHNFSFHVWPRIVKQAGVPYRALKQTLPTFATLMLQQGAPLDWLQRQIGHEDLETPIKHYWKYINPRRLSSDVVARLEALGRETKVVHRMPNYCPTRLTIDKKPAEIQTGKLR
jgi:hypothetical protein